jgi:hypothetical protein
MLDVITKRVDATINAQAWRVEFVDGAITPADGEETIEIIEPRRAWAVCPTRQSKRVTTHGISVEQSMTVSSSRSQ